MDLVMGTIVPSANDAAVTLGAAIAPGGPANFVALMNDTGTSMGLTDTRFSTASGMGDGLSTGRDMSRLVVKVHRDFPAWRVLFSVGSFTYRDVRHRNTNALLFKTEGMTCMKTGTLAPDTHNLITRITREGRTLFTIILGAPTRACRNAETRALINNAFLTINDER